eukprot:CAMPEP_0119365954 /NCGR_PEP_ID=MMETSP1334-20130426/12855_1 /TAXON_ID=127549 /ORGANISM="Calcidiscus leptoporus, Strain RCC1130" /LENGTH=43 /DNA_ID= /DNA_START= /DNA_END= /DNA_ORIENTATION=
MRSEQTGTEDTPLAMPVAMPTRTGTLSGGLCYTCGSHPSEWEV